MEIINQRLIDKFVDLINQISNSDKVAIFYDPDGDGTCSVVMLQKALERLNKNIAFISNEFHGSFNIGEDTVNKLKEKKITHIFTLDLPVDYNADNFKFLEDFKTIIIDHHILQNVNHPHNIFLIKPQLFTNMKEPNYYCTSKLVYDLMLRLVDINDLKWLAITGLISDYCWKDWDEFLREGLKQYKVKWKDYLYDTDFGMLTKLITAASAFKDNRKSINECKNFLYESNNLEEALKKCKKFNVVNKVVDDYILNFSQRAERYNNACLLILELDEPYSITSSISTAVSTSGKFPNTFILVAQKNDERIHISARIQHSWDANKILKECIKGFKEANAGGHVPASGASMKKEDYQTFKERLIKSVNESTRLKVKNQ